MHIYLIGVSHDFQIPPQATFEEYVFESCIKYGIRSIGEEMCKDALDDHGASQSVAEVVAQESGRLPYSRCSPGREERKELGISTETLLEVQRFQDDWTDDEFREKLAKDRREREAIWLERLKPIYEDPMLFICGIAHLETFSSLLKTNGYGCTILSKNWDSRPKQDITKPTL